MVLLSCGHTLGRLPLFARYPMLLEDVAPLLLRSVAVPGNERLTPLCTGVQQQGRAVSA